jgi:hypothetical protein
MRSPLEHAKLEIENPAAKTLFVLIKATHLIHFRMWR